MSHRRKKYILQNELPNKVVLIQDLHDIARSLGRTPTQMDLRRAAAEGRTYQQGIYARVFGKFTNALRAARLPFTVNQEFTREELLEQLRNLSDSLKRKITREDVLKASQNHACARLRTFSKEFGSVAKALEAAGVKKTRGMSKEEMLQALRDLAEKLDRIPSTNDVNEAAKRKECPSDSTYLKHFGSFLAAISAAGLGTPQLSYTNRELLQHLSDLADELGRPPLYGDISERAAKGLMPGTSSYQRRFGGLDAARKAAGIKSMKKSESEMLKDLRELAKKVGHTPSETEMIEAYRMGLVQHPSRYRRVFGGIEEAHDRAGLKPLPYYLKRRTINKKEIILQLQQLTKKLGHAPTCEEITAARKRGECVGIYTLTRIFGSRAEAYRLAGITLNAVKRYSREELLDQLRHFAQTLGRTPMMKDLLEASKRGESSGLAPYRRIFGGFQKAIKAAGLKPNKPKKPKKPKDPNKPKVERPTYTREQLIEDLRQLAQRIKRLPTEVHIKEASKRGECATSMVYYKHFGGIPQARRAAGLDDPVRYTYTRERLVKDLRKLSLKIKRPPTEKDINAARKNGECANVKTYYKHFGSISNAREAAGLSKTVSRARSNGNMRLLKSDE